LHYAGLNKLQVAAAAQSFCGVARRLTLVAEKSGFKIFEDFAHHPSAVRATLAALRQAQQPRQLWAVFEPRSNTSRRKVFQQDYVEALAEADNVIIKEVTVRVGDEGQELLDPKMIVDELTNRGRRAYLVSEVDAIVGILKAELAAGDVAVLMSNGSFDGLIQIVQNTFRV
jgi:UDP-N-acetylmuramate: L-alanyl-gamma-D-glutamyl-meso-diaminopimelate ligase